MSKKNKLEVIHERSLAKGLLAGLIGGLVATAAKSYAEKLFPPRPESEPGRPALLAQKIAGHRLDKVKALAAGEAIHWGFGAATGAAYGALAEYYPAATTKDGAGFGMALSSLTHGTVLPALGLAPEQEDQTFRERTSEMAALVTYGVVTETVRRFVRKRMG